MNEYLIEAKKVLELIPLIERYNSKFRKWGDYPKHIAFILKAIEKSGWSFTKACSFLKIEGGPPIEQQFRMFKKGWKTTHESWDVLNDLKKVELSMKDFFKSEVPKNDSNVKKVISVCGKVNKTENLTQNDPEYRLLIQEILDGKHPNLKILIQDITVEPGFIW